MIKEVDDVVMLVINMWTNICCLIHSHAIEEAKIGEKEWYFFYQKDRKYPSGLRANRATKGGYWKATGRDKEVDNTTQGVVLLIGMKKTLVFYRGKAPKGDKTNWVMHEYRLEGSSRLPDPASASSSASNVLAMKASASKVCGSRNNNGMMNASICYLLYFLMLI